MALHGILTPSAFTPFTPDNSSLWDMPHTSATSYTTVTLTANRLYAVPYIVGRAVARTKIGINVTTGVAGSARLGIYAESATGQPGALIVDAGTVDITSIAQVDATISSLTLAPGRYFLAVVGSAGAAVSAIANTNFMPRLGMTDFSTPIGCLYRANGSTNLASDESAASYSLTPVSNVPVIVLKK